MDYGSAFEGETDDIRLARVFRQAGIPVARVIDVLPGVGAIILEDLGDETLESAVTSESPDRADLYMSAVRTAVSIATRGTRALAASDRASGPALDEERFRFEMEFFLEHFVRGFLGVHVIEQDLRTALTALAVAAAGHPRVLCHRDFHSRNIMVRADRSLALVDIQDARWGPDTYDLASLLRDAYVDVSQIDVDRFLGAFCDSFAGSTDTEALKQRFDITTAQRMLKALGTFGYQVKVLGRRRYLTSIARTIARLSSVLHASEETVALGRVLEKAGIFQQSTKS
jgi:aminoglycoside/choline kinase family phosphotransferase